MKKPNTTPYRHAPRHAASGRVALAAAMLVIAAGADAEDRAIECRLYIAESVDHASAIELESSGATLNAVRRAGMCVFADGSIADKQFVMGQNVRDGGAAGDGVGLSTYTFDDGSSLTLSFTGGWDGGPFEGDYTVLGGTGAWEGATGTGTIVGTDSPWTSTSVVDIRIDVTLADS